MKRHLFPNDTASYDSSYMHFEALNLVRRILKLNPSGKPQKCDRRRVTKVKVQFMYMYVHVHVRMWLLNVRL